MESKNRAIVQHNDWYQDGAACAQEAQAALRTGKTFKDMNALPPEEAARAREHTQIPKLWAWWDGYVSRWD